MPHRLILNGPPAALFASDVASWRRTATQLGTAGAGGLLLCATLPSSSAHDSRVFVIAAVVSVLMAGSYQLMRGARERWFAPLSIAMNLAFITWIVASLEHTGAFALFYIWPLLSGAMLMPTGVSVAIGVAAFALCGAALAVRPDGMDLLMWLNVGVVNTGVTGSVRALRAGRDRIFRDLQRIAETDGLTGVHNRTSFETLAERVVARAAHAGDAVAFVLFDIDHFKQLNDGYGHAAGDAALRGFGEILRAQSRPGDLLARVGGEEFAVLMPGTSADDARRFAERVAGVLRAARTEGVTVTVSAGVAALAGAADDAESLMRRADRALYAAKAAGRDRVLVDDDAPAVEPLAAR